MLVRSMKGDWRGALRVRGLMARGRIPPTVHVYNALLAACERARQWCAPCPSVDQQYSPPHVLNNCGLDTRRSHITAGGVGSFTEGVVGVESGGHTALVPD